MPRPLRLFFCGLSLLLAVSSARAQSVAVTLRLDTNMIGLGGFTTLHVEARIVPTLRDTSDRIFSWYVDVLNTKGVTASANYPLLQKPTSDNDPATSSTGVSSGNHRRGIFDTFLNRPGAGRDAPIELLSIPVTGLAAGRTRFQVQAGSGQAGLSEDFYVAPSNGGAPYTGGDYANAFADLQVSAQFAPPRLFIQQTNVGSSSRRITLRYEVRPAVNYFIEFRSSWGTGPDWQTIPGGPFNAGLYVETNNVATRFYRARLGP